MTDERIRLLDANVLVALVWPSHIHHDRAHRWFDGGRQRATTPVTESALLRLSLNASVTGRRVGAAEALEMLATLRKQAGHSFVPDDATLAEPAISLERLAGFRQVTDLHLVNLCATRQLVLATLDSRLPDALAVEDRRHVELIG